MGEAFQVPVTVLKLFFNVILHLKLDPEPEKTGSETLRINANHLDAKLTKKYLKQTTPIDQSTKYRLLDRSNCQRFYAL